MRILRAATAVLCFTTLSWSATFNISGTVVNAFHRPVAGVAVTLSGIVATTNSSGAFVLTGTTGVVNTARQVTTSERMKIRKGALCLTLPVSRSVAITVFSLNGAQLNTTHFGMLSAGRYSLPIISSVQGNQMLLIQVNTDNRTEYLRVSALDCKTITSAPTSSPIGSQAGMQKMSAAPVLGTVVFSKDGYLDKSVEVLTDQTTMDSTQLEIEPYGLQEYAGDVAATVPRYSTSGRAPKQLVGGPPQGVSMDTVLTWELFKNGSGGYEPSPLAKVLGNNGLPFYSNLVDYMIDKVNTSISSTGEVIDTSLALVSVAAGAPDSLREKYHVEKILNLDNVQMDMLAFAASMGNVLPNGSVMTKEQMRIGFALTDSVQYVVCRARIAQTVMGISQTLNAQLYAVKTFGADTTFTIRCEELTTIPAQNSTVRTLIVATMLNDTNFLFNHGQYTMRSPTMGVFTKTICAGNKNGSFGIRRILEGYNASSVLIGTRADQYFIANSLWSMLTSGVNSGTDDAYLPTGLATYLAKSAMIPLADVPAAARTAP